MQKLFQSTLLVRGATKMLSMSYVTITISIHAPRERSDNRIKCRVGSWKNFNPRSSWEERLKLLIFHMTLAEFQSTLLVRGATICCISGSACILYFNPRSSWEERPSDLKIPFCSCYFNPRSSWEERLRLSLFRGIQWHFNPRSSWEERQKILCLWNAFSNFNPRSSWEERQLRQAFISWESLISIHAPRERSDRKQPCFIFKGRYFNPRSSWEERQKNLRCWPLPSFISIHAPRERSDYNQYTT